MQLHSEKSSFLAISIVLFIELFLSPITVLSQNCSASPIVVPVTNTTLSTGFQRRGLPVSIGTPPQQFSLKVYLNFNNTVFQEGPITDNNCNKTENSVDRCIMVKAGVYDRGLSSSWSGHMTKEEFRGASDVLQSVDLLGEETVHLPGVELQNVPIDIDGDMTSGIGLGTNSSLVNSLYAAGKIPSRMWGLDWGWTGATDDTWKDGSLVLGGYDKSRVKDGKFFAQNFPLDLGGSDGCALIVFITGISMKNDTDEIQLLDSKGESIRACVAPQYDLITLPFTVFSKFNDVMGDVYVKRSVSAFYLWGYESDVQNGYKGSMTITLSNGFTTTIPNHELIQPYRDYNFDGQPVITNPKNVLMLNSLQQVNAKDLPLLGIPFLSSSYLVVDPDQGQFQLGETVSSSKQVLVPGTVSQCPKASPTGTQSQGAPSPTASQEPPTSSGSNSKVIVGAAVGVSVVGLAVAAIIIILCKKSRKPKVESVGEARGVPAEEAGLKSATYELSGYSQHRTSIYEADSNPIPQVTDNYVASR